MADNDKFLKSIGPCWAKPYAAAHGHGDPCEVSELTVESLCSLLRKNGGFPEFADFVDILEPYFQGSGLASLWAMSPAEARQKCDALARRYVSGEVDGALAHIQAKVALGMIFEVQMEGPIAGQVSQVFAERVLLETRKSLFIDRLEGSSKVVKRFELAHNGNAQLAAGALFDFQRDIEAHIPEGLKQAARKLAEDASGQTLSKRPMRMPKRSAAEFVNLKLA